MPDLQHLDRMRRAPATHPIVRKVRWWAPLKTQREIVLDG